MKLPMEIIEEIVSEIDISKAVRISTYSAKKAYNKCSDFQKKTLHIKAIETGDLVLLKWMYYNVTKRYSPHMLGSSIDGGNLEIISWVIDTYDVKPQRVDILRTLKIQNLETLKYINKRFPRDNDIFRDLFKIIIRRKMFYSYRLLDYLCCEVYDKEYLEQMMLFVVKHRGVEHIIEYLHYKQDVTVEKQHIIKACEYRNIDILVCLSKITKNRWVDIIKKYHTKLGNLNYRKFTLKTR